MYKYILQEGGNINWMALLALLTFVSVFIISGIMVLKTKNETLDRMSKLPLEDEIDEL